MSLKIWIWHKIDKLICIKNWQWGHWGGQEAHVALVAALKMSSLLDLVSLIFLLTVLGISLGWKVRLVCGPTTQEHHGQRLVPFKWGQVPWPVGKWKRLLKAGQQTEVWSSLKCPGRRLCGLWTSGNPEDQHRLCWLPKPSRIVETHLRLQATWFLYLSTLPPLPSLNFTFKPLSKRPVLFLYWVQVRRIGCCLWLTSGLTQGMSGTQFIESR